MSPEQIKEMLLEQTLLTYRQVLIAVNTHTTLAGVRGHLQTMIELREKGKGDDNE